MQEPKLSKQLFQALLITICSAAIFHLVLVTVTAIIRRDVSYVNPLDFLGLSIILPQYREVASVALGGWIALVVLYFTFLYIIIRFHLYLSIIKEHPLVKKFSESSLKLQEAIRQQSEIYEQTTKEILARSSAKRLYSKEYPKKGKNK